MSKFRKTLAALTLLMLPFAAHAFKIKGKITDAEGDPQAYATYHIYLQPDTAKAVKAGTAGADGEILTTLSIPGDYLLKLSYVGAADKTVPFSAVNASDAVDLGTIAMSDGENTLGELQVEAQKPLVTKEIDRVGYDVQADAEASTSTLSEMLRKVPMVAVDSDGTITVNGSSNFQVYKNGRPSKSYSNNAKDIFKAIPASMIKRIEVITEPGAKYDAEGVGAILNIVTVENLVIKGVMGNVGLEVSNRNLIPGANLWLNSQIDKVAFSVYGGYRNFSEKDRESESFSRMVYDNGNVVSSHSQTRSKGNMTYFGGEASYELDSLNLFTAEFNGYYYGFSSHGTGSNLMTRADGSTIYSYNSLLRTPSTSYLDLDANVNYQHLMRNPGEMINIGYQVSTNNNHDKSDTDYKDQVNMPVEYTGINMKSDLRFIEHTFQFDWTKPFAKIHTLDLGAKAIIRRNHSVSHYDYKNYRQEDIDFSHVTDVAALYAQYSARVGAVGLRAGLRYEYSHLKAEQESGDSYSSNLNNLVPSASASWQINGGNSLTFNYASRINRPGISYLNPAVAETPDSKSSGNPDLNSAMHHSFKFTYMYIARKFNCNISADYEFSNNGIAAVNYLQDDKMTSTYFNIGHYRSLSFNGFLQWSVTSKISLMANGGVSYTRYTQPGKNNSQMELARWTPFVFARYSHKLPWKLNGQLSLFMFSQQPSDVYSYSDAGHFSNRAMWMVSLGRSFLKEDRLNVRIEAMNPIGRSTRTFRFVTTNGDYTGTNTALQKHLKGVRLSVSYRFGSLNSSVKKTARSITNDDMVGGRSASEAGGTSTSGGGM